MFSACKDKSAKTDALPLEAPETLEPAEEAAVSFRLEGNRLTYGSHVYTVEGNIGEDYVASAKARVTFTHVPADLHEFQTVYEQLLGKMSYGVCAMMPMAFELWGRSHEEGEQCLKLICGATCYNEVLRELPRHMEASEHSPAGDSYVQRCLPAALLEGATKENGYNPAEPYAVNISVGRKEAWKQESELLQADVFGLNIVAGNAWNTAERGISVMLPWRGDKLFKVNSCPALYVNIFAPRKDWNGLK